MRSRLFPLNLQAPRSFAYLKFRHKPSKLSKKIKTRVSRSKHQEAKHFIQIAFRRLVNPICVCLCFHIARPRTSSSSARSAVYHFIVVALFKFRNVFIDSLINDTLPNFLSEIARLVKPEQSRAGA